MRTRRYFPTEEHPQINYDRFLRLGEIKAVSGEAGTAVVGWYDIPGQRQDVLLSQADDGNYTIPAIGSVVVCGFDSRGRAIILRYIPKGYLKRRKTVEQGGEFSLPPVQVGERVIESYTPDGRSTYTYWSRTGNIESETASGRVRTVADDASGTHVVDSENVREVTDGGVRFWGLVKRFVGNTVTRVTKLSKFLIEYRFQVDEYAGESRNVFTPSTPLFTMTLGTRVNDLGVVVNKKGVVAVGNKEVALHLEFKSGVVLDLDKEGRVSLRGAKININDGEVDAGDLDIAAELEVASTHGTRGQHAAREHDGVAVPVAFMTPYTDEEHKGLTEKAVGNYTELRTILRGFTVIAPGAPITPSGAPIPKSTLQGEIVEGAKDVYIGGDA